MHAIEIGDNIVYVNWFGLPNIPGKRLSPSRLTLLTELAHAARVGAAALIACHRGASDNQLVATELGPCT